MNKQYDNNVLLILISLFTSIILIMIFYKAKCFQDKEELNNKNKFVDTSIHAVKHRKDNNLKQVDNIYNYMQNSIQLSDEDLDASSSDFRTMRKEQIIRDIKRQYLIDSTHDLSKRINNYIENRLLDNNKKYNYINDYLDYTKNNIDRPIYDDHVAEFMEYKKKKDLIDAELVEEVASNSTSEKFEDQQPSGIDLSLSHDTVNFSTVPTVPNDVVGEEEIIHLYPTNPDDFYGSYKILPYQYKLLDNMIIHLLPTEIKILDSTQLNYEIKYGLKTMKKMDLPEFPTTTIELVISDFQIPNRLRTNVRLSDEIVQLIYKRKKLLKKLGMENRIYLYGNDGEYRIYNSNKTLMFNIKRTSTI